MPATLWRTYDQYVCRGCNRWTRSWEMIDLSFRVVYRGWRVCACKIIRTEGGMDLRGIPFTAYQFKFRDPLPLPSFSFLSFFFFFAKTVHQRLRCSTQVSLIFARIVIIVTFVNYFLISASITRLGRKTVNSIWIFAPNVNGWTTFPSKSTNRFF